MSEKFSTFDAAEYLDSEEAVAAYLEAAQEDAADDPGILALALSDIARARNMSQLAKDAGLTRAGLYKALAPHGNPRIGTLQRIAKALDLRVQIVPAHTTARGTASRKSLAKNTAVR